MVVRIALAQTVNAYGHMPSSVEALASLADHMDDIRGANLEHAENLIVRAVQSGAKLVLLSELFAAPYFALCELPMWRALAEDACTGPTVTHMRDVARRNAVVLVVPIYERDATSGQRFNTAVIIDERGTLLGSYRKTHIPTGVNETAAYSERYYYGASDGEMYVDAAYNISPHRLYPVFDTSVGRIGVAICYDRHFDGVMRTLATGGAQLVLSPAVTFGRKSQLMWRGESATDAARHRFFIACSNRGGAEAPWGVEFFGDSHVMGPEGPLEDHSDHPELVLCDVDLASLGDPDTAGWNLVTDRRADTYAR